jgi:hypothetical protein
MNFIHALSTLEPEVFPYVTFALTCTAVALGILGFRCFKRPAEGCGKAKGNTMGHETSSASMYPPGMEADLALRRLDARHKIQSMKRSLRPHKVEKKDARTHVSEYPRGMEADVAFGKLRERMR